MTDKEYLENLKNLSNRELIEQLEYCDCDTYYRDLWEAIIKELKRRVGETE